MSFRIRTLAQLLTLGATLAAGTLAAQAAPSPLTGWMVSGGVATLRAGGGGIWYPQVHLAGTGRSGWGGDLGVGVYTGDGFGIFADLSVTRAIASKNSSVGGLVALGPTAVFGEGGVAFGAGIGGALLVQMAPHFGLRIDIGPRIYVSDGVEPAITIAFSLTSLPGGWGR